MSQDSELKISIVLDDGSIKTGFLSVEKSAKDTSTNMGNTFNEFSDKVTDKVKAIGTAIVAAFAVEKIIEYFKRSIDEASQAEKANNALAASLLNIGRYTRESAKDFNKFADELERTTGIQDNVIKQNAAVLASVGNLSGDTLKKATKASLDLSQALQIDVGTAFNIVSKAADGNTAALRRYGIKVNEGIPVSQRFAEALKKINDRFGGLAESKLDTFEGALTNIENAANKTKTALGELFVSSGALRAVFKTIAQGSFETAENIKKFGQANGDIVGTIIIKIIEFALAVNEYLLKPLELGFNFLLIGVNTVKVAINGLVFLLATVASAIVSSLLFPIELLLTGISKLVGFVDKDLAEGITSAAEKISNGIKDPFINAAESTKEVLADSFNDLSKETENAFTGKMTPAIEAFLEKLKANIEKSKGIISEFKDENKNAAIIIKNVYENLTGSIKGTLVNGLSTTFQAVGKNLQSGVGLFDDFGNSLVGIFGDILIMIGNALILQGLAVESFIEAITSLLPGSGFLAAAAGVGLVVFGSALKASVSKGGSSAASSSTGSIIGGGVAASPSAATENAQPSQLQKTDVQTKVQVVVQGSIYDSSETGSRIVDLINSAFNEKGVVVQRGVIA